MSVTASPDQGAVIDLFAGPGGWSQGLRQHLGIRDIGLEWDTAACRTRQAAGHLTIQTDVATYPTRHMAHLIRGLIASPPCTLFSSAGKGTGRRVLNLLAGGIRRLFRGDDCRDEIRQAVYRVALAELAARPERAEEEKGTDEAMRAWAMADANNVALVLEPARWIAELLAAGGILEWVCLEQVPALLPLWKVYVEELHRIGWSAWTGILNAADYGVPQTRRRAILIASKVRTVTAPAPTHYDPKKDDARTAAGQDSLFAPELPRWISMAQALGWDDTTVVNTRGERQTPGGNEFPTDQPSWALTGKTRSWILHTNRDQRPDGSRQTVDPAEVPAPTPTAKSGGQWVLRNGNQPRAAVRPTDEPAPTMTFGNNAARIEWVLRTSFGTPSESSGTHEMDPFEQPAHAVTTKARSWTLQRPATTVCATDRLSPPGHRDRSPDGESQFASPETVRITVEEAAVIQTFPADYPWAGSKTKRFEQIGNAVPPLLAAHVVAAATGLPLHRDLPAALATA